MSRGTKKRFYGAKTRCMRHVDERMINRPEIRDLFVQVQGITFSIRVSKGEAIKLLEAAQSEGREVTGDYLYNALYLYVRD